MAESVIVRRGTSRSTPPFPRSTRSTMRGLSMWLTFS